MTFISVKDRPACIAAMIQLQAAMSGLPGFEDMSNMTPEEIRTEIESGWDHDMDDSAREILLAIWQSMCIPEAYYECHLTFEPDYCSPDTLSGIGEKYHFRFSSIDGDEQMGNGERWYLTRSLKDGPTLTNDMNALTVALTVAGVPILRRKIEHIVFDERRDKIAGTGRAA